MPAFEKIIGYEDIKTELRRICDIIRNPEKYAKLGVKIPKGLLLVGDPGVGKTTMAKCFLEMVGRETFVCRKQKPDDAFVYEIGDIFEQAKKAAPSIVFLDDMDKYANEDEAHKNAEEFVVLQACIDAVDEADVFVIGTANSLDNLPESLLRAGRFDKTIEVRNPTGKDAEKIVQYYLSQKEFVADINAAEIAGILDGRSCADLETVLNEAGIYAGFENKEKIDMDDVIKACLRVIYNSTENTEDDNENLELIAYHEAGHALIGELLAPGTVHLVTVKNNHGNIGGFTQMTLPQGYWYSKKMMENRVVTVLGGKAATEIIYGTVDVGTNDDLRRAFDITERFVEDYCSHGFDRWSQRCEVSNDLLSRREMMITAEMERLYEQARRNLIENRECLIAVARALKEEKTLTGGRLRGIMEKYAYKVA